MYYSVIRRAAYESADGSAPWHPELHTLAFTEELATTLKAFHQRCRRRGSGHHLPVRSLNGLLQAAAPGVLAIGRGAAADESVPWLYAREPVPIEVIRGLLNAWVMQWPPAKRWAELESPLKEALHAIGGIRLEWTREPADLFAAKQSVAGTAIPDRRLFALLPEQIAFHLAADTFGAGMDTLSFRVVTAEHGAEIVSWPPLTFRRGGIDWRYSATVKLTVQTAPFTASFRVHATSGVRRWVTRGPLDLRGRSATVLFDVPSPWASAEERRHRLIRNAIAFDDDQDCYVWRHGSPTVLLSQLDLTRLHPEADELASEPERWLAGVGGVAAGLVFREGIAEHKVAAGLMPVERKELDEWVEARLAPGLRRVPDMERVVKNSKPLLASSRGKAQGRRSVLTERRRAALIAALGGEPLDVEVLWQDTQSMDCLVASLRDLLDLPPGVAGDRGSMLWEYGELRIMVHGRRAGTLVEKLAVPGRSPLGGKVVRRTVRIANAIRDRRREVGRALDVAAGVRGAALSEIGGPRRFPGDTDPKFAVRLGSADAGRVSQFFLIGADTKTPLKARAAGVWMDLFRQLGAVHVPVPRVASRVPKNLQYVGVWMVSRRSDGPTRASAEQLIAVRVRQDEPRFPVRLWDRDRNSWVPYPDFLTGLARHVELRNDDAPLSADTGDPREPSGIDADFDAAYELGDAERDLRAVLYQVRDRPTLVLLNSGNLRFAVPGIGNEHLVPDSIRFGDAAPQRVAAFGPDLRLALIRDHSGRDETPQWYASAADSSRTGFSAGLWQPVGAGDGNRVFASSTDVPKLLKKKPRGLRKLFSTKSAKVAPAKSAWNPRLLEITVLGCVTAAVLRHVGRDEQEADIPADYAGIAHQLRFLDDFDPLGLPMVQHWAKKAVEYLLPLAEGD